MNSRPTFCGERALKSARGGAVESTQGTFNSNFAVRRVAGFGLAASPPFLTGETDGISSSKKT